MKVIVITTDNKMSVKEIENNLGNMVDIGKGYIEPVYPNYAYEDRTMIRGNCFICDEEGLLKEKPINYLGTLLYNGIHNNDIPHPIAGDIFICGCDREDFRGLSDGEIEFYQNKFGNLLKRINGVVEEEKNV